MEHTFHYLLMANQATLHKQLLTRLSDTPLTQGQPRILDYLKDHDGANQTEIASGCHVEPPTLSALLNRMEDNGLIERRTQNKNRRTLYVYLTPKGQNYQEIVDRQFKLLDEAAFYGFTPEEKHLFMDSFMRIYENLKKKRESEQWKS